MNVTPSAEQQKQQALAHLKQGQLEQARALYTELCASHPRDADAWQMLGTVNGMLGRFAECEACSRRVLELRPGTIAACNNLGAALLAQNRSREAFACFESSLRLQPDNPETLNYLAKTCIHERRFADARAPLEHAVALSPKFTEAYYNLGNVLRELGEPVAAETCFATACALQPGSAALLHCLAATRRAAGRLKAATTSYRSALQLDPDNPLLYTELANVLEQLEDFPAAIDVYRQAVRCVPDSAEAHYNLAHALQAADQLEAAAQSYRRAIALKPALTVAYNNLGLVYQNQRRFEDALACFNTGLQHSTETYDGTPDRAPPGPLAEIHWHRAVLWLLLGTFHDGWKEYEWRWSGTDTTRRDFSLPDWQGEPLHGKILLVYAEQGVGDELMFASCYADVLACADQLVIDCDKRLVALFQRSFPAAIVHGGAQSDATDWLGELPPVDLQCAAGSLPRYLRPDLEAFPVRHGYLIADANKLATWQQRYAALGSGLKVGLSWRGGNVLKTRKRSTTLELWAPLLRLPGVQFINLQYGDCKAELALLKQASGVTVHDWEEADPLKDLDDFAAQVAALDLVISVDNATVHMAGALGVPVWILQPFAPEWRWLTDRDDSYWYSGVRNFRQPANGRWEDVFASLLAALADHLARHDSGGE